jgi:tetratricopeptide (TPR) repeat protein
MVILKHQEHAESPSFPHRDQGPDHSTRLARRLRFFYAPLVLVVLLSPTHGLAQGPGPGGGFGGLVGVEANINTNITVQVRGADGSKLKSMAIVNLSNPIGQLIRSQTTYGSQTVFQVGAGAYIIEVEAFGYDKARVQTEVSSAAPQRTVVVALKPESSGALAYGTTAGLELSPKAQKELSKGVEYYQARKFDEAVRRLESARQIAPTHPDIDYLLGTVYDKKGDLANARKYWDQAIQLAPNHVAALLACAESYLRQSDVDNARRYLDKAVEVAPNSWRAHSLLANALLRQNSYPEAVAHAQRAVELEKAQGSSSSLLMLGQALAAENQNEKAIAALNDYLATKPPEQQAQAVQKLIARLTEAPSAPAVAAVGGVTTSVGGLVVASDIPDPPLSAAVLRWLPANVDDGVPPVEPGVSCSLDDVLKNVSARVQELPAVVDRYTATEVLHQEDVNNAGVADSVADLSFNYLASVREIKNKYGESLDVQEYRNGSTGTEMFPNKMASVGLPSIVLIFHPILVKDFDMKCEGLSRAQGSFAWQVYFRQRADQESRIRRYRMGGHVFPIALKGRAWIDANTLQIVRLETDLREPHPELRLNSEHLVMQYGPVKFKSRKEELWLPSSADYYAVLRGQRFHRRHSFTNYILFSVEHNEKIGEPPSDKPTAQQPMGNP